MTKADGPVWQLPLLAVMAALGAHFALQLAAWTAAGGHFEYPLDDPYIHLAIAEQIARGNYGVNAGEVAAAASSPLYPLLLLPFPGEPIQRYLPLAWNVVGLIAAAYLWGRILAEAGYRGVLGLSLAIAGPLALNIAGLAFVGMEHILHLAASLAILLGLMRFCDSGRIGWLLMLGIILGPLFRLEGLALSMLAAGAVFLAGRRTAGLGLLSLAVLPVVVFALFLAGLGLSPVPSSVYAKLAVAPEIRETDGALGYVIAKLSAVLVEDRERILAVYIGIAALFWLVPAIRRSDRRLLLLVVGGAGLAHLLFGRFGWLDRYESYVVSTMAAGLLAVAVTERTRLAAATILVPMGMALWLYLPINMKIYPDAPRAVLLQQAQMARFAKEYLKQPVAVNDLGYVAWANDNYVLDVWGLANRQALELRLEQGAQPGWIGALTDAQDVPFAMVYDAWFHDELGSDWRLLGQLATDGPTHYLGGDLVNFFLTDPARDPAPYRAALAAWAKDLPLGATFSFSAETGG